MNTLISLSFLGVITLFLGIFNQKKWLLPVVITGLIVTLGLDIAAYGSATKYFESMFYSDHFNVLFSALMIAATIVVCLVSAQYYKKAASSLEGIYAIILFTLAGGILMVSAANLATFFVGLEILSISLYVLAGSHKTSFLSNEAAMKYFLMGSFASAFLLFGIALLYGATGSIYYQDIAFFINHNSGSLPLMLKAGVILVAIGMAFKVAAAPFHFWAPDVYHGSPSIITAFMITTVKVAGFASFLRLTMYCFGTETAIWTQSVAIIAALSIIIGNITALAQNRIKRMLAYSSISHTGYILIALVSLQPATPAIFLYYAAAYVTANLAAFIVLILIKQSIGNSVIESFNGLSKKNPVVAFCATIAFLSLTGIPPLAGFMGKYLVFTSAIEAGYLWLVIIAILGSIISIFYYFRPIINMYMKESEFNEFPISRLSLITLVLLTLVTVVLGFLPGLFL